MEILNLGLEKNAEPKCLLIQAKEELETKLKEKKIDSQISIENHQRTLRSYSNEQQFLHSKRPLAERRVSTISSSATIINEPSSTTISSFANRLSLSNKSSINKSTTPNENLLIKSTVNRPGFEILEDSDENRQSADNENTLVNQPNRLVKKPNALTQKPLLMEHQSERQSIADKPEQTKVSSSIKNHEKVKQNLIEKLKPLDDQEPKVVIFDKLKPDQRFFADLKRIYKDNTEYSFEEIRMKKLKRLKSTKEQSVANIELLKEIEFLKAKLKENEERDKEKESLQNQVDILKRQIEMIIANSVTTATTTCSSKRVLDEVDGEVNRSKKLKLSENRQLINSLKKEKRKENEKEDLTIVREMWNATFASQNSPGNCTNFNQQAANQQRKDFTIFKDATQTTQFIKTNDFSYYPHMMGTTATQEHFTIALPHDPSEFRAKLVSTPTSLSKQQKRS